MNNILFVDDKREVYDKFRFFRKIDYAKDLEEARFMIYSKRYDLIITDYHLGEKAPKGGIEIIKIARSLGIETILMSTQNHEEEGLEAGAKRFIFKKELLEKWTMLNPIQLINLKD